MADDDVYANFGTEAADSAWGGNPFATGAVESGNPLLQAPPSQWGTTGSRLGQGGQLGAIARPMTSNRPVGFNSTGNTQTLFDPTGQNRMAGMALGPAPPLKKRSENSPEELCMDMERQVNKLIEESAMLAKQRDFGAALEKAKEAGKKDRLLCKQREELGLGEQVNVDLTYAVHFNLAVQYQNHELYTEALNTYNLIIRNTEFPQAGRLRVNMGNIYASQKKYSLAIKMYKTCLDETPVSSKELRNKLYRNIGNCFVKLGQFRDAVNNFETIVENGGEVSVAMNLLLCYYALGETEKVKRTFNKMLNCRPAGLDDEEDFEEEEEKKDVLVDDALRNELKERRAHFLRCLVTAARLIAPIISKDWREGYDYVIQQLRQYEMRDPTSHVASELEMCKYLNYLKHKRYREAITGLKEFEKKDPALRARAATNLAYLYFLEGELDQGEKYSDLSIEANQYNAKALVNKGNFLFKKGSMEEAKEYFNKALAVEADNIEAIYNLGLCAKHLGLYEEAVKMFKRVQALVDSSEVLYQIADLNDLLGDPSTLEWFSRLIGRVPTDPNALARMGALYARDGDETQAFHYYLEAYRYYQVNMDVISWLGAYFVKNEVYDKAVQFFERASQIQPNEIRWPLMIASCHRRRGDVVQAKRLYEQVHRKNPENVECIKYLVQLCKDSGLVDEANEWFKEMKKAERKQLNEDDSDDGEEKGEDGSRRGSALEGTESAAGRKRGGAGLTADLTAGFSDDEKDLKKNKKKASDSDDDLDIPGLE